MKFKITKGHKFDAIVLMFEIFFLGFHQACPNERTFTIKGTIHFPETYINHTEIKHLIFMNLPLSKTQNIHSQGCPCLFHFLHVHLMIFFLMTLCMSSMRTWRKIDTGTLRDESSPRAWRSRPHLSKFQTRNCVGET